MTMKDQVCCCLGDLLGFTPGEAMVATAMLHLPNDILLLSEQWGANDTEVRDKTYVWLREVLVGNLKFD